MTPHVIITIDLDRIRENVRDIALQAGVDVYAVVKADAYGLGVVEISAAVAPLVSGFCVFSLREAAEAQLWQRTGKPSIILGPPDSMNPADYLAEHARPAVATVGQAQALRAADPVLAVDVGMQRFACPETDIDAVTRAGSIREAFAHAANLQQVRRFVELMSGRGLKIHAAASSLLDEREAQLDAVRPGLTMYRGALRITARLVEVRSVARPGRLHRFFGRAIRRDSLRILGRSAQRPVPDQWPAAQHSRSGHAVGVCRGGGD